MNKVLITPYDVLYHVDLSRPYKGTSTGDVLIRTLVGCRFDSSGIEGGGKVWWERVT